AVAHGESQRVVLGERIRGDWWHLFGSRELDALVARAFAANPTIEAAQASLRAARENAAAQRGFFFPTVAAGYNVNRTKQTGSVPASSTATPADAGANSIYTFHTAQLTVGYTADVFGGTRRAVESLDAQAEAQRWQLEAAYITLAANVVGAVVQDALLQREVALVQEMIADSEESLRIVNRQWNAGAVSHLDVALQETVLAQVRQQLPPLRKQLEQNRDLLRTLVGATQDERLPSFDLDGFELPVELPVALPAQLVERRPDVRAAEEQLHAASAQIGVARAARLPQFTISADVGAGASTIAEMFSPAGRFYSFVAGITQPVFDGGSLGHREAAARATYDQAAAQYRLVVLSALQNVADALHAIDGDAQALAVAADGAKSARTAAELSERQFGRGYLYRVALIAAQQADRQASLALLQARASRLGDTAALFQSIAGPWDEPGASRHQP
ncbi:MAG: efflux transporter outer membrane subunit, partial [Rhizobacter sp.]|nr:efflux transporter outer membrane subunit [Rhizobacter sp.]